MHPIAAHVPATPSPSKPSHPPPKSQPPSTPHDAIAKEAPATHPIAHLLTLGGGHMSDPLRYFNLQSGH